MIVEQKSLLDAGFFVWYNDHNGRLPIRTRKRSTRIYSCLKLPLPRYVGGRLFLSYDFVDQVNDRHNEKTECQKFIQTHTATPFQS